MVQSVRWRNSSRKAELWWCHDVETSWKLRGVLMLNFRVGWYCLINLFAQLLIGLICALHNMIGLWLWEWNAESGLIPCWERKRPKTNGLRFESQNNPTDGLKSHCGSPYSDSTAFQIANDEKRFRQSGVFKATPMAHATRMFNMTTVELKSSFLPIL